MTDSMRSGSLGNDTTPRFLPDNGICYPEAEELLQDYQRSVASSDVQRQESSFSALVEKELRGSGADILADNYRTSKKDAETIAAAGSCFIYNRCMGDIDCSAAVRSGEEITPSRCDHPEIMEAQGRIFGETLSFDETAAEAKIKAALDRVFSEQGNYAAALKDRVDHVITRLSILKGSPLTERELNIVAEVLDGMGATELSADVLKKAGLAGRTDRSQEICEARNNLTRIGELYAERVAELLKAGSDYAGISAELSVLSAAYDGANQEMMKMESVLIALRGGIDRSDLARIVTAAVREESDEELDENDAAELADTHLIYEALTYFDEDELVKRFGPELEGLDKDSLAYMVEEQMAGIQADIERLGLELSRKQEELKSAEARLAGGYMTARQVANIWISTDLRARGIDSDTEEAAVEEAVEKSVNALMEIRNRAVNHDPVMGALLPDDYAAYGEFLENAHQGKAAAWSFENAAGLASTDAEKYFYLTKALENTEDGRRFDGTTIASIQGMIPILIRRSERESQGDKDVHYESPAAGTLPAGSMDDIGRLAAEVHFARYKRLSEAGDTLEADFLAAERELLDTIHKRTGSATYEEAGIYGKTIRMMVGRYTKQKGRIFRIFTGAGEVITDAPNGVERGNESRAVDAFAYVKRYIASYRELVAPFTLADPKSPFREVVLDMETEAEFNGRAFGLGRPEDAIAALTRLKRENPDSIAIIDKVRRLKGTYPQIATGGRLNEGLDLEDHAAGMTTLALMLNNDTIADGASNLGTGTAVAVGAGLALTGVGLLPAALAGGIASPVLSTPYAYNKALGSAQYRQSLRTGISPIGHEDSKLYADAFVRNQAWQTLDGALWSMTGAGAIQLGGILLLGTTEGATGGLIGLGARLTSNVARVLTMSSADWAAAATAFATRTVPSKLDAALRFARLDKASWTKATKKAGELLKKVMLGKPSGKLPPPNSFRKGPWKRIANYLNWYNIDERTGEYIFREAATGNRFIYDIARKGYINLKTGELAGESAALSLEMVGPWRGFLNAYDAIMTSAEKGAAGIYLSGLLAENAIHHDEEYDFLFNWWKGTGLLLFANRLGIERFKLNRGGQRGLFWLDRVGDAWTQYSSGAPPSEVDMQRLAIYFATGTVIGQARGKWLIRALARSSDFKAINFVTRRDVIFRRNAGLWPIGTRPLGRFPYINGIKISAETFDTLETSYGQYTRRTALKSEKIVFEPSKQTDLRKRRIAGIEKKGDSWKRKLFGEARLVESDTETGMIRTILRASNGNLTVWVDRNGQLYSRGVMASAGAVHVREIGTPLSQVEREILAKELSRGKTNDLASLFGRDQGLLKLKLDPSLNLRGVISFCAIHDLLIGTIWDGLRLQYLLQGDGVTTAKWTGAKSLTTLPLQNLWKLKFGWETKMATLPPRLIGRDLIDLAMTRMFPLWEGKGLFVYSYKKELSNGAGSISDFLDMHIGPRFWDKGGLSRYSPSTMLLTESRWPRYEPIGVQHVRLAELYLNEPISGKKKVPDKDKLGLDDFSAIDRNLSELIDILRSGDAGSTGYTYKEALMEGLALAMTATMVRERRPELFQGFATRHPDIIEYCRSRMDKEKEMIRKELEAEGKKPLDDEALAKKAMARSIDGISSGDTVYIPLTQKAQ